MEYFVLKIQMFDAYNMQVKIHKRRGAGLLSFTTQFLSFMVILILEESHKMKHGVKQINY